MIPVWVKWLALAGVVFIAVGWWRHDRQAYADAQVAALRDAVKAEADKDWARKLAVAQHRADALGAAASAAEAELGQLKELNDEKDRRIAVGERIAAGLRDTLVRARRSEVHTNPGDPCHTQELRAERLAGLLAEGQRSCAAVADSAGELERLVLESQSGARRDAVMLRWWTATERALRLGEDPPGEPTAP